jgi:hypothetical protein
MANAAANGLVTEGKIGVHAAGDPSMPNSSVFLAEAMATAQRTAAVLMAAHSASNADAANASSLSHEGIAPSSAKPGASTMKGGVSFVIPKNKLSGALVPVTRNVVSKWEPTPELPSANDQGKKTSRKTKWGLDLTDNPIVKRGRALALQVQLPMVLIHHCFCRVHMCVYNQLFCLVSGAVKGFWLVFFSVQMNHFGYIEMAKGILLMSTLDENLSVPEIWPLPGPEAVYDSLSLLLIARGLQIIKSSARHPSARLLLHWL